MIQIPVSGPTPRVGPYHRPGAANAQPSDARTPAQKRRDTIARRAAIAAAVFDGGPGLPLFDVGEQT